MTWQDLVAGRFGANPGFDGSDPLLLWADGTGFEDFIRPDAPALTELRVTCELAEGATVLQFAAELLRERGGYVPAIYLRPAHGALRYCTAVLTAAYCRRMQQGTIGKMVRRIEMQMPVIPERPPRRLSFGAADARPATKRPTAGELLLGVIDSGCPFAHRSLRSKGTRTRVLAIWDQDAAPAFAGIGGSKPEDFGYGAEVFRTELNAAMKQCKRGGSVGEEDCYRLAGQPELLYRMSHGAAVLDLMAGPRALGARLCETPDQPPIWSDCGDAASKADIVFVDLPRDGVQDSSSSGLSMCLLDGLRYILDRAGRKTKRIVVNISNGSSRSTHDGSSVIELAMLAMVQEQRALGRELHIVLPAGNDYDEERHAQVDRMKAGNRASIKLRVPPGSEAPTWITLRQPPDCPELKIGLKPPRMTDDAATALFSAATAKALRSDAAHRPAAGILFPQPMPGCAGLVLLVIAATSRELAAGAKPAAHGDWEIVLESSADINEPIHLFVSRNQRNPGSPLRGRQARFVQDFDGYDPDRWSQEATIDPKPPRSPIRRAGTLNGLATGASDQGVYVVGGIRQRDGHPSNYSSAGPSAGPAKKPSRVCPDTAAVTDLHRSLPGIVTAGHLSGVTLRMRGTSFAAPQVARYVANHGVVPAVGVNADPERTGRGGGYVR